MNYSITQKGKPLDKSKYIIDEENKTFSSKENDLYLNFYTLVDWSFKTGDNCKFKTGSRCNFITEGGCVFHTGNFCVFNAGWNKERRVGTCCIFHTGYRCTFHTGWTCEFNTLGSCVFNVGSYCEFDTGWNCIFNIGNAFIKPYYLNDIAMKIKTLEKSTISIPDLNIHVYLNEEIEVCLSNGKLLYTKDKLTEDQYKMLQELKK